MWRVELLGKVQIVRGDEGGVIARFESRKVAALLARLALFPARVHPREELAALLWPDADRQGGLARLRHVLSSLGRQTMDGEARLGPLFIADRFSVRLGEVECDAVLFERAAKQKRLDEARTLYTGDLLPGFYDDWIITEQERLRALFDGLSAPVSVSYSSRTAPVPAAAKLPVAEKDAELPVSAPATAGAARGFLPHYLTTFWGRETEKQTLRELLAQRRLITVVGPVGCGKTRFVVEFARDLLEHGDAPFDQIVFVPLGECAVPEQIVPRLRAALQLPPTDAVPIEQIALALDPLRVLFVLDDAEHLAEGQGGAAGEIIGALLARLPRARCIVSSRRLLHIPGEQAFALEPLPLPDLDVSKGGIGILRENPCIALLCDRAKTVRPDFAITPRNREAALRLCRELEGVPLAIELAAGRIRAFSLQQMCDQLEAPIDTVGRGSGRWALTTPPAFVRANKTTRRHHSLHEAIGASWQLLGKRQQEFFAALSVLRGQWTLSFAAHISGETEQTAHALLEELTDHSLLQLYLAPDDAPDQKTRWALLQTVSDFAHSQLSVQTRAGLRRRLSQYVLHALFMEGAADDLLPSDLFVWEAALPYAIADSEADESLALCIAFNEVWLRIGSPQSALQTIQAALRLPRGAAHLRASASEVGSFFAAHVFDFAQCQKLAQTAWENAEQAAGESAPSARASAYLARARAAYVRQEAPETIVPLLRDAENYARQIAPLAAVRNDGETAAGQTIVGGNRQRAHLLTSILNLRGASQLRTGNYQSAEADLRAAQDILERQPRPSLVRINQVRFNRVSVAHQRGDLETALGLLDTCAETALQTADLKLQAQIAQNRGAIYSQQERWSESVTALCEAVRKFQDLGMKYGLCYALWNLSRPLVQTGAIKNGVFLLAFARAFWKAQSGALDAAEESFCQSVFAKAAETVSLEQVAAWQVDGQSATLGAAVACALDGT